MRFLSNESYIKINLDIKKLIYCLTMIIIAYIIPKIKTETIYYYNENFLFKFS